MTKKTVVLPAQTWSRFLLHDGMRNPVHTNQFPVLEIVAHDVPVITSFFLQSASTTLSPMYGKHCLGTLLYLVYAACFLMIHKEAPWLELPLTFHLTSSQAVSKMADGMYCRSIHRSQHPHVTCNTRVTCHRKHNLQTLFSLQMTPSTSQTSQFLDAACTSLVVNTVWRNLCGVRPSCVLHVMVPRRNGNARRETTDYKMTTVCYFP